MTLIKQKICQLIFLFCILLVPGSTYDPKFELPLPNLTAKQGTEVSFTCVVNHLGEYKVAWIKADDKVILAYHTNKVSHNPRYHVTHNGHNTWTLIIKNLQLNDSGSYMCQINTLPMTAQVGRLDVVVAPDILDEETSGDIIVSEGDSTTLKCKAQGAPPPKLRWKRQDGGILPISTQHFSPTEKIYEWEGETLPLRALAKTDNGPFLCIASNNIPPLMSKRIMLYVQFKPLIKVSNQLVAAPVGINVTLECDVESVPKPFISWTTKDGQLIVSTDWKYVLSSEVLNDYRVRVRLMILNLKENDFTDYNCSARNTLGEDTGTVKLQRIYPPPTMKTTEPPTTHHPLKQQKDSSMTHKSHSNSKTHGKNGHNKNNNYYPDSNHDFYDEFESSFNNNNEIITTTTAYFKNNLNSGSNNNFKERTTTVSPWSKINNWRERSSACGNLNIYSTNHFIITILTIILYLFLM